MQTQVQSSPAHSIIQNEKATPYFPQAHNCTSLFTNLTSSPGLNAGNPIYGHPSHLNASPSAQLPHEPTLPCTVKSTSARSSACSLARLESACARLAASSAFRRSARPQLQSLQARRRLVLGRHASAVRYVSIARADQKENIRKNVRMFNGFILSSSVNSESGSILSARASSALLGIPMSSSSSSS